MARLSRYVRSGGFRNFGQYLGSIQSDASGDKLTELIDAMTTNHTSFLREPEHFRFLVKTVLPTINVGPPLRSGPLRVQPERNRGPFF